MSILYFDLEFEHINNSTSEIGKCTFKMQSCCRTIQYNSFRLDRSILVQYGSKNGFVNETISFIFSIYNSFCRTIMTLCRCIIFTPEAKVDNKMVAANAFEFVIANGCKTEHAIFLPYL